MNGIHCMSLKILSIHTSCVISNGIIILFEILLRSKQRTTDENNALTVDVTALLRRSSRLCGELRGDDDSADSIAGNGHADSGNSQRSAKSLQHRRRPKPREAALHYDPSVTLASPRPLR